MPRYLIEVPHENNKAACERAVHDLMSTGSHFVTHADWGCPDNEHKAWFIVELENKDEAKSILPPSFRQKAKIITLQRFTMEDLDDTMGLHKE